MSRAAQIALFAACVVVGTLLAGWWLIPGMGMLWVRALPRSGSPVACAAGSAMGWLVLLGWDALHGPVAVLAQRVGGVFLMPGWMFTVVTLLFAALLAASGALAAKGPRTR